MIFNRRAFLGQVPLLGQPAALPVTVEQFRAMAPDARTQVLNGLSNDQACLLYQQLYALTKDPQDEEFMKSWCKVAGK
jgi:hypothetical protein